MTWKTATLGEVTELITRGISPIYSEGNGIFILNQKCIRNHEVSLGPARKHDSVAKVVKEDRKLKYGDVLVNSTGTGTLGRVAQILSESDEELTVDSHVTIIRPYKELFYLPFFGYMLIAIEDQLKAAGEGASGQTELRRTAVANEFLVSYPTSKVIQQKIVAKLDAIFAAIDKATAAAEANAENSCDLYSSAVNLIFERLTNRHIKLSSCSAIGYGYTSKSSIKFTGPQYLRITDIQDDRVDWLLVPRIEEKISEVKKFLLKDGDIVFARTGATTGKSYLIKEPPFSVFASYLIRVDPDRNSIEPEYLRHFFRSENYWTAINAGISGAAQGGFNASKLGEMMFPLPAISIQKQLVKQLDEIEHLSLVVKKSQENKVKELNCLKQSILRQAFNGGLVKD